MVDSMEKQDISLSIRDGLYMPFMYKGRQIVVHNAAWSFREKIWVDDDLVVNRLGFSIASTHVLNVSGDRLEITFGYRNRMKEVFLEARTGAELIYEASCQLGKDVKPATVAAVAAGCAIAGAAAGYGLVTLIAWLIGAA